MKDFWCSVEKSIWLGNDNGKSIGICDRGTWHISNDAERRILLLLLREFLYPSYIDKMWGILRQEAFPEKIVL